MLLAIFAIHFMNVNYALPVDAPYRFMSTIGTAACLIIIPLVDTSRIIILRLLKGKSPFRPDKNHIHHAIMRLGKSHSQTTIILAGTHLFYISMALILHDLSERYVLLAVVGVSVALSVTIDRLIIKRLDVKEVPD